MTIQIRNASEEDIPELARLIAAITAYHESLDERARYDWDEVRKAPEWLQLVLNRSDRHQIWVADFGDGHLVGYLWINLRLQREGRLPRVIGYIRHAFIEESWRGKGLMKPMLDRAYEWFRAQGISVVTLAVLHRNWIGSSAWYRYGFQDWNHERMLVLKPHP
jgi:GNAT superfamily N-acetyltransferase